LRVQSLKTVYLLVFFLLASNNLRLLAEGEVVRWSIDGAKFAVQAGSRIDIYTTVSTLALVSRNPDS
jgi:hypothetical protein